MKEKENKLNEINNVDSTFLAKALLQEEKKQINFIYPGFSYVKFNLSELRNYDCCSENSKKNYIGSNISSKNLSEKNKNFCDPINSIEKEVIKSIYPETELNIKLMNKLKEINECPIIKYGLKESIKKVKFSYCKTCDKNLISPICEACMIR